MSQSNAHLWYVLDILDRDWHFMTAATTQNYFLLAYVASVFTEFKNAQVK